MSENIRAGVIGFGMAGQIFHAAVIHETPGLELAAIVERSGKTAAAKYPGVHVVSSVDELLADPTIALCVVATPNDVHQSIAEKCLRASRHVVIDKPFTLTSEGAAALAATAREQGVVLSAFHNRRWDGDYQTLQSVVASGRLGTPLLFESHYDRYRPQPRPGAWRETHASGGGILFDLGPHLIDQALATFGAPSSLWADLRTNRRDSKVDDAFDLQFTYEHAVEESQRALRVWLRASMIAASPGARFTLHGTLGSFEKWGLDPQEAALKEGARFSDEGFGAEQTHSWGILTFPEAPSETVPTLAGDYRKYYQNVQAAIADRAPLVVGVSAAWSVARVIELARESSSTGCRVAVDLSAAQKL